MKVGANNKRVPAKRNLLPGYVLVEAALDGEITHMLRNTPNVLGFLGGTDKPSPVRQAEVNRMLGLGVEENVEVVETVVNVDFLVGESVKVNDGPFTGFDGIIEEVNTLEKAVSREALGRRGVTALVEVVELDPDTVHKLLRFLARDLAAVKVLFIIRIHILVKASGGY